MRTALKLFPLLLLAACGKHPGSYTTVSESTSEATAAANLVAEADALWDERVDEGQLQAALDKYQAVVNADPTNRHALIRLTRGWYFWGDAFTQDADVKVERWGKAIEHGTQCIALNEKVAEMIQQGAKEKDAITHAVKEDAGCIYWTATALGKWGKIQSLSKTLKHLPTVKAYVSKVEALDPSYYHYGPARYWAAYYAALPSFAGQDLDRSAEYFDGAIDAAPYYLPTRVLRAEYWAVATQDLAQFDEDLAYVIGGDPDVKPGAGITPENVKDIDKAVALCERRAELFDKKAIEEASSRCAVPRITKAAAEPTEEASEAAAPEVTRSDDGADDEPEKTVERPEAPAEDAAAPTVEKPADE